MEKKLSIKRFGLLGRNISYSFSRSYFTEKFNKLNLKNYEYVNFDIQQITDFQKVLTKNKITLCGMNVTIPYKQDILPFLDSVSKKAVKIGAINTIKINKNGTLKGYNTDEFGFRKSLQPLLKKHHKKALILGTGGASKAVAFALQKLGVAQQFVSRNATENTLSYQQLTKKIIQEHTVIINCTPLGTHPNVEGYPNIPYVFLTDKHLLYDLIYNPAETLFLQKGKQQGATTKNGLEMLELQAEKAWKIWNMD